MLKHVGTAVALLLLGACSGEPGDPIKQMHDFCERWVQIERDQAESCGWSASPADASCDDPAWRRSFERLEQGRVRWDSSAAATCLQFMRENAHLCAVIGDCSHVLMGKVEPGGSCGITEDCAGEAICRLGASCPGTCVARPAAGAPCDDELPCATGYFCQRTEGLCIAYRVEGESCETDTSAGVTSALGPDLPEPTGPAPTSVCDHRWQCAEGRCVERSYARLPTVGPGARCKETSCTGASCETAWVAYCTDGLFCNDDSLVCAEPGRVGDRCPDSNDLFLRLHHGVRSCRSGLACFEDACTPVAADGDSCEGTRCPGGSPCIEGSCIVARGPGAACTPGSDMCGSSRCAPFSHFPMNLYCDEETATCVEPILHGEACGDGDPCFGNCEAGICRALACAP